MHAAKCTIWVVISLTVPVADVSAYDELEVAATCACEAQLKCGREGCSFTQVDDDDGGNSWKLFGNCSRLDQWGITIGGHLEQGITTNSRNPTNPAAGVGNFPATQMNYRNDEYMFNSLYLTIRRKTETGGSGWDIGGNIDLMYGTNYVFLQSRGLETNPDLTNRWNSNTGSGFGGVGLMGLALPQLYLEVAYDDLTVQLGHFYLPLGYERQIPTENNFYSNSYGYTFSFETFQVLGLYANWKLNNKLQIGGGFHRGMGNWEDNNDDLSGFGAATWLNDDGNRSLSFVFNIGNEADIGTQTLYVQSLIFEQEIGDRWSYVIHSDFGCQQNVLPGDGTACWYNVVQQLAFEINHCWAAGLRFEWFDDVDGFAVSPTPGPGVYYDLTLGLNYTPTKNLVVRPEVRWDWFDADGGVGPGPFGNGTQRNQFMAAVDVILTF